MDRARVVSLMAALLLAGWVMSAQAYEGSMSGQGQPMASSGDILKASELIGMTVWNDNGDRLGKIDHVVLAPDKVHLCHACLVYGGGFLGIGEHRVAVPMAALRLNASKTALRLDLDTGDLTLAPAIDRHSPDNPADATWRAGVDSFYRAHSAQYRERAMTPKFPAGMAESYTPCRLDRLIGASVKNSRDERLGSLDNVLVDLGRGRCIYGIVAYGGFFRMGERLAAFPWSTVTIQNNRLALLDTDRASLDAIAFSRDSYPDFTDARYALSIDEHYGSKPYSQTFGFAPPSAAPYEGPAPEMLMGMAPGAMGSIHGRVVDTGLFRYPDSVIDQLKLRVRTDDGKILFVDAGLAPPDGGVSWAIRSGDFVRVTGTRSELNGRPILKATEIVKE